MQISSAEAVIRRPEPRAWVERVARLGYIVKGTVYGIMAGLAVQAALNLGGRIASEREAVEHIGRLPFGELGVVVVGVGLLGYALWRLVEAAIDPYREGRGVKGIILRLGAVASGVVNGAVGIAALKLVIDGHHGGETTKPMVASMLREPWGPPLLIVIGLGVIGAGFYQLYSAYADKFADHLRVSQLSASRRAWTLWSGRIGHAARGVIFGVIGVALVEAGLDANARHTKGFKEVMYELASQPHGRLLFGVVAAGFLIYGLHLVTTARCRKLV